MSKKKNLNKKFIIGSSIALLVISLVTFGATWGIIYATMDDPTFIKLYINGQSYDINGINDMTASVSSLREEEGETVTDNNDETINDSDAEVLADKFYSAALFGTTDYVEFNRIGEIKGSLLVGEKGFNVPESFAKDKDGNKIDDLKTAAQTYKNNFIQMKLFNETLQTPIYKYLVDMNSDNPDIITIINGMEQGKYSNNNNNEGIDGLFTNWEYTDINETKLYDDLVFALKKDIPYQSEVLKEMFVYSYLWQNSKDKKYDYNFTKALVESKASLVSQMKINSNKNADLESLQDIQIHSPKVSAVDWNKEFEKNKNALVETDLDNQLGLDGFKGFEGIKFGTTENTSFKKDFYDSSKTWDLSSDWNSSTTINGYYSNNDIFKNANYYVASEADGGAPGKGAVISDEDTSSTLGDPTSIVTVVSYSQLYPYMFSEIAGEGDDVYLTKPSFSLYASFDENKFFKAKQGDQNTEYIFKRWFGDNHIFGEIYVAEAIMTYNSLMKSDALEFWNNEGYYIELSGEASTDYTSLLPTEILKKEKE